MNAIFRRGFNEYKRGLAKKKSFARQTERLQKILRSTGETNFGRSSAQTGFYEPSLLLLLPLVETAWADGRVTRRETEAILRAADSYGLVENEAGYRELMERLLSRPAPAAAGRMWQDFRYFLESLPERARKTVTFGLLAQARFVAEQSSDNVIGFLRGERICRQEMEALQAVAAQLKKAKQAAEQSDRRKAVAVSMKKEEHFMKYAPVSAAFDFFGAHQPEAPIDDFDKLIPLVPLIKTAWAEGRVTRRERRLIFEAAARLGIKSGTRAHARLTEWLEQHPTEEFYERALDLLLGHWRGLDADEKKRQKLDLLSDCTRIAEASGGTKKFPAGGGKICEEEIFAVKHIARKLNGSDTTTV